MGWGGGSAGWGGVRMGRECGMGGGSVEWGGGCVDGRGCYMSVGWGGSIGS